MFYKVFFIMLLLLIFGQFLPRVTVAGLWLGIDDILPLLSLPLIFFFYASQRKYIGPSYNLVLPLFIFVVVFGFYGILQGMEYLSLLRFPTELWQYLKRAICFLIAAITMYHLPLKKKILVVNVLLGASFLCLFIGILQLFNIELVTSIYGRSDAQISNAMHNSANQRVYSITGHSISWGGMSLFIFYAAVALLTLRLTLQQNLQIKNKQTLFLMLIFFILCLVNVISSGSRGAMIAFVVSFTLYLLLLSFRIGAKSIFVLPLICCFLLVVGYVGSTQFDEKFAFILYRFEALGESAGGGRDLQVLNGLALLSSWYEWPMGVSNAVQRSFNSSWGIESEPFNILVNYGFIGFSLIYSSILIILLKLRKFFLKGENATFEKQVTYDSIFCGVFGYLLFSLGFFYFAELIVGVYSWLVYGVLVGAGLAMRNEVME
ncbi:hypothetical protein L1285_11000 [Pseudoalteromonas sp. DL2-H2.2]|uniref:hypothetical protein n=1 Tax=Pseudoalteromonas sp. DL2-H2.2 TaxID=2908889 RepID=UPI001F31AE98|nr:hypothetical protein [Pseudoalteromonas sp. DL2-H2.2]MCF2908845.1 hypothetical protein [Pseudoalteromonas sp. DL2-H2.2]